MIHARVAGKKILQKNFQLRILQSRMSVLKFGNAKTAHFGLPKMYPRQMRSAAYYQSENYISHSDTNEGLINKLYHKVRIRTLTQKRKLIEKLVKRHKGNILDVGCGTGCLFKYDE